MKKCIAFMPNGHAVHSWRPCPTTALRGRVFCRRHERTVAGIVLGICINDIPDPEIAFHQGRRRKPSLEELPVAGGKPS